MRLAKNILPFVILCIPLFFLQAYHSKNTLLPRGDAAEYLELIPNCYWSLKESKISNVAEKCYLNRIHKSTAFGHFLLPALFLTQANLLLSVQVTTTIFFIGFILSLFYFAKLYLPTVHSALLSASLSLIPWLFTSSHLYMTEIPYIALTILCLGIYFRMLKQQNSKGLFITFILAYSMLSWIRLEFSFLYVVFPLLIHQFYLRRKIPSEALSNKKLLHLSLACSALSLLWYAPVLHDYIHYVFVSAFNPNVNQMWVDYAQDKSQPNFLYSVIFEALGLPFLLIWLLNVFVFAKNGRSNLKDQNFLYLFFVIALFLPLAFMSKSLDPRFSFYPILFIFICLSINALKHLPKFSIATMSAVLLLNANFAHQFIFDENVHLPFYISGETHIPVKEELIPRFFDELTKAFPKDEKTIFFIENPEETLPINDIRQGTQATLSIYSELNKSKLQFKDTYKELKKDKNINRYMIEFKNLQPNKVQRQLSATKKGPLIESIPF